MSEQQKWIVHQNISSIVSNVWFHFYISVLPVPDMRGNLVVEISRIVCMASNKSLSTGLFSLTSCQESGGSGSGGSSDQQIQCYACGFPKVHPENDMPGSYGSKTYNHSCDEFLSILRSTQNSKKINRFIRTCPAGVQSCFGATGVYDKKDKDPKNDVRE